MHRTFFNFVFLGYLFSFFTCQMFLFHIFESFFKEVSRLRDGRLASGGAAERGGAGARRVDGGTMSGCVDLLYSRRGLR